MRHKLNRTTYTNQAVILLMIALFVIFPYAAPPFTHYAFVDSGSAALESQANFGIKALAIVPSSDLYQPPYTEQIAINIMRDWGIPFDVVTIASVSPSTFWDYQTNSSRYQFAVYFGSASMSTQGSDPSRAVKAIDSAIANGTSFLFVGPAVISYERYFGISGYSDCPAQPQNGAGICGETLTFGVMQNFSGIVPGSPTYRRGEIFTTSGASLSDIAMPVVSWNGTGTEFMNATVGSNNAVEPNVIYRNYNGASLWWWGGTEGQYAFYREGWQEVFYNAVDAYQSPQLFASAFEPEVDLFYYALNNITIYNVGILPWSNGGSAEVIRAEDHASMCQYTQCGADNGVIKTLLKMGLVGEINVDLNGWSDSIEHVVSPSLPPGLVPPPGTVPGYVYYGNLGPTWGDTYFAIASVVDNQSSTTPSGFTKVGPASSLSQSLNFADGNTTELSQVSVLVNTSSSVLWNIAILEPNGSRLYVSPVQNVQLAKPTWVNFSVNAQGRQQSYGIPDSLQTNLVLELNVTSGTVDWWHARSQADYIAVGRSYWDIVYIAKVGSDNFSSSVPLVPDSILMANGNPYPQDNKTIVLDPQNNMTYPGELHAADIVGEFNSGPPGGANFEVFFTIFDWEHYGMNAIHNFQSLVAKGWVVDPNGWTHAKDAANDADNDFRFGNGSIMPPAERTLRIEFVESYFNTLLGPGNWSKYWAFGTDAETYYPAIQQLKAAGFVYAQLASEYSSTLDYVLAGYWKAGPSSMYSLDQTEKVANGVSWSNAVTFNETREELGVISTHSDSTYPYNDYELASNEGWVNGYGLQDTWFCGTTTRCLDFWSATMQMLMNGTADFNFDKTSGYARLTMVVNTGHSNINSSEFNDPLVFRLPDRLGGFYLYTVEDNSSAGSLAQQEGGNYYYYVIDKGSGWLNITVTYGSQTRLVGQTVRVSLIPYPGANPINSSNAFMLHYQRNGTYLALPLASASTFVVDPGSTIMVSGASIGSNSAEKWVISGSSSPAIFDLAHLTTYSFTLHYYDLLNVTVSAKLLFGGTPPQFNISYNTVSSNGTLSEVTKGINSNSSVWMLRGTDWNVTTSYTSDSGAERWVLKGISQGEVNGSYSYQEIYYHQYMQIIGFSMMYGNSLIPPSAEGYQKGNLTSLQLNEVPTGYWFDAFGRINFTNPIFAGADQRWVSQPSSVPATRPNFANLTYVHQYFLTFQASKLGEGTIPSSGWYNSTNEKIFAQPAIGYMFKHWVANSSAIMIVNPTEANTTISVNGPGTLVAVFGTSSNYFTIILLPIIASVCISLILVVYFIRKRSGGK
jgi:hypothetical protein